MAGTETFGLIFKTPTTLTIASGVVTVVQGIHIIAAQTGTADDLDTITNGIVGLTAAGVPRISIIADSGDTITLKHGVDNIDLPGDVDIDLDDDHYMELQYDGTNWRLVGDYL